MIKTGIYLHVPSGNKISISKHKVMKLMYEIHIIGGIAYKSEKEEDLQECINKGILIYQSKGVE